MGMDRTAMIIARATPEERAALLLLADYQRRKPSETLRELVRSEAKRAGVWELALQGGRDGNGIS